MRHSKLLVYALHISYLTVPMVLFLILYTEVLNNLFFNYINMGYLNDLLLPHSNFQPSKICSSQDKNIKCQNKK
jgi:hypothetical protein